MSETQKILSLSSGHSQETNDIASSVVGFEQSSKSSSSNSNANGNPVPPYDDTLTNMPPSMTRSAFFAQLKRKTNSEDTHGSNDGDISAISAHRQSLIRLEDQLKISLSSGTQTPLASKIRNPFEETPDSERMTRRSGFALSTPLARKLVPDSIVSPSVNAKSTNHAAAEVFRNLRDEQEAPYEFDSEVGIILNERQDDDENGDDNDTMDSGIQLNLNGATDIKDLLNDIGEESSQEVKEKVTTPHAVSVDPADDVTIEDGDVASKANEMLKKREEAGCDGAVNDYSLLSEINDTTVDYESAQLSASNRNSEDSDHSDDVQVPNSVNNTASTPPIESRSERVPVPLAHSNHSAPAAVSIERYVLPRDTQVLGTQDEEAEGDLDNKNADSRVGTGSLRQILVASSPRSSPSNSQIATLLVGGSGEVFSESAGQKHKHSSYTQGSVQPSTENRIDLDMQSASKYAETLRIESSGENRTRLKKDDLIWTNRHKQPVILSDEQDLHVKETVEFENIGKGEGKNENDLVDDDIDLVNYETDSEPLRQLRSQKPVQRPDIEPLLNKKRTHNALDHPKGVLRVLETSNVFKVSDYEPFDNVFIDVKGSKIPVRILDLVHELNGETFFEVVNFEEISYVPVNGIMAPVLLRVGDRIKYSKDRRSNYEITGLEYVVHPDIDEKSEVACVRGYNTVYIRKFASKKSSGRLSSPFPELQVALGEIYMNTIVYGHYHFRVFDDSKQFERFLEIWNQRNTIVKDRLKRLKGVESLSKLCFDGCLFVTTTPSTSNESLSEQQLAEVDEFIKANGGTVVQGFEECLKVVPVGGVGRYLLQPSEILRDYKFVALLSSRHLRTLKYLQCLCVGWPILSFKFIFDCISNSELYCNQWRKFWPSYLLPSGKSSYRDCILSMNIFPFEEDWKKGLTAYEQVRDHDGRTRPFEGHSILVDNTKRGELSNGGLLLLLKLLGFERILFLDHGLKYEEFLVSLKFIRTPDLLQSCYVYSNHDKSFVTRMIQVGLRMQHKLRRLPEQKMRDLAPAYLLNVELRLVDWEWLVQCIVAGFPFLPSDTLCL
ncbi:hypothetical protein FOA43_001293 [Brettanomyces nanus]|uniref:Rad9-like Rad53-binding domain-containing protein n=1 Tax=Eeniella nana TaxID=13502 RepID=A0A875RTX8_EENNA|nr:uncharacterized protein FOA43_001293 [Brettanomyces nanus]QPG73977.1 hypothetical protein FOA43_001293 [Brettanomyces nanus]